MTNKWSKRATWENLLQHFEDVNAYIYIFQVLKQVLPGTDITSTNMSILNFGVNNNIWE